MQNTGRKTAEKSFIVEALIISLSNFVVKIIGVLFKIPMTYILGVNMGIFNAAYSIYAMLFMLSITRTGAGDTSVLMQHYSASTLLERLRALIMPIESNVVHAYYGDAPRRLICRCSV